MATIIGSESNDILTETVGADTIIALGGDDTVVFNQAGSATESADGGAGSDRLVIDLRGVANGGGNLSPTVAGVAGRVINLANFEHYSFYRDVSRLAGDGITTGAGDDLYHYAAANDASFHPSRLGFVDLGGGLNDRLIIDASAVTSFGVQTAFDPFLPAGHLRFKIGGSSRIDYVNIEHLELIGSPNSDSVIGLVGSDVLDGRDGNDTLSGLEGSDRLIGGNGDDTLNGGEGDDVLAAAIGTDTAEGGNGNDRLEIDARGRGLAVSFSVSGGPTYAGTFSWAAGSVAYSGIEGFIVYSDAGSFADNVQTGDGDDVFYHYAVDDINYAMDIVDLGGGSNDLLVADFSAVTSYSIFNTGTGMGPPNGHLQFFMGATTTKIDYVGVERLHFIGGAQGDYVNGLAGNDILNGGAGFDSLSGHGGDDDISGGSDSNTLYGGEGNDVFRSVVGGFDTVHGGNGTDTAIIDYSTLTTAVTNTSGGEVSFTSTGFASATLNEVERIVITTGSGNDSITTLGGNDEIRTGAGTDSINAGGGDDLLDGGTGADSMSGGAGNDLYFVDDSGDSIGELSGEGTDEVRTALAVYSIAGFANVEKLTATTDAAHDFRGNSGNNVITGGGGGDFLRLQDGGDDTAVGGAGNDVFLFGAALTSADQVDGGVGTDQIAIQGDYWGAKALTLGSNVTGIENLAILPGNETQFGDPGTNFYDYSITVLDSAVAAGVQLVVDANRLRVGEDFTFEGSAETDGSFLVYGGSGTDMLTGGAKNDVSLFGDQGQWGASDALAGGAGIDQLALRGDYTITFGATQLTGIEQIAVVSAYDTRFGALGDSYDYNLTMNDGNVAGIQMTIDAGLLRSNEVLTFNGSAEDDGSFRVFGGDGNDVIQGSQNGDVIVGRGRGDTLYGNGGNDVFRYNDVSDSNPTERDGIQDFNPGDLIDLSRIDANALAAGDQAFSFIGNSAFSNTAGQLRFENISLGGPIWMVQGDTDGNGTADFEVILVISPADPITASDFIL